MSAPDGEAREPGYYCETWEDDYVRPSDSLAGVNYTVSLTGPGSEPTCECKGYEFTGKCKHVRTVMQSTCLWRGDEPLVTASGTTLCPKCGSPALKASEKEAEEVAF